MDAALERPNSDAKSIESDFSLKINHCQLRTIRENNIYNPPFKTFKIMGKSIILIIMFKKKIFFIFFEKKSYKNKKLSIIKNRM